MKLKKVQTRKGRMTTLRGGRTGIQSGDKLTDSIKEIVNTTLKTTLHHRPVLL